MTKDKNTLLLEEQKCGENGTSNLIVQLKIDQPEVSIDSETSDSNQNNTTNDKSDAIVELKTNQSEVPTHSEANDSIQNNITSDKSDKIEQLKTNQLEVNETSESIQKITSDKSDRIEQLETDEPEVSINSETNDSIENNTTSEFQPIKNLKFCGMRDPVHPKLFIENFEHYANQENFNEEEKKHSFVGSLRKYAAVWLEEQGHGPYEEMKEAFLSFYWSSEIQDSFVKYLDTGKYTKKCRLSMANYFFKHAIGAKFLDASPSEKEIIEKLLKHFESNVEDEIVIQKAESIEKVIDILKRIDVLRGNKKIVQTKSKFSMSTKNKKSSFNSWGWLFLLLAFVSLAVSFFSKLYMKK